MRDVTKAIQERERGTRNGEQEAGNRRPAVFTINIKKVRVYFEVRVGRFSAPSGVTTLSLWDGLRVSMTPRALSAGVLNSW